MDEPRSLSSPVCDGHGDGFHSPAVKKDATINILRQPFKRKSVLKVPPRKLKFGSLEVIFAVRFQDLLRRVSLIPLVKASSELAFPGQLSGAQGSGPDPSLVLISASQTLITRTF